MVQFVLWNRSPEEQPVEASVFTMDGAPVTMEWSHGVTGATASVVLPPQTQGYLTARAIHRRKADLGWARITAPASAFSGYALIDVETATEHWATTVAFIRDDQPVVILPIICNGRVESSYLYANTLPTQKEETRTFEAVFHMAESGTRTARRAELGGGGVISFHAPKLLEPPDVGFLEIRALDGKAGFFATATYLTPTDRGIFRAL